MINKIILWYLKNKLERELMKLQIAAIELQLLQTKQAKQQIEKQSLIYLN